MFLGIDIGGTKCAVLKGVGKNVVYREAFATMDCKSTLDKIFSMIEKLDDDYEAIGISCGGPLDEKKGIIQSPPNLPGWDNVEIVKMLEERFNKPAFLLNDANACALAEWKYGAGQECDNMAFLTFGTGLGAGLIINGRLYSGTNGNAGEVGHIRLAKKGEIGFGKYGSFEGFCSGGGIARMGKTLAKKRLEQGKPTAFCPTEQDLDKITAKLLAEYANKGDKDAKKVYDKCGYKLGEGLSIIIDMLNPQVIVIGSVFARSQNLLVPQMQKAIKKEALSVSASVCKIVPAVLGEQIGDVAALITAEEGVKYAKLRS